MAHGGEGDSWDAKFLDYVGLGLILTATEILVREAVIALAAVLYVLGGAILAVGVNWARVKPHLSAGLVNSIGVVANDIRYWLLVLVFLILVAPLLPLINPREASDHPATTTNAPQTAIPPVVGTTSSPPKLSEYDREQRKQEIDALIALTKQPAFQQMEASAKRLHAILAARQPPGDLVQSQLGSELVDLNAQMIAIQRSIDSVSAKFPAYEDIRAVTGVKYNWNYGTDIDLDRFGERIRNLKPDLLKDAEVWSLFSETVATNTARELLNRYSQWGNLLTNALLKKRRD